MEYFESVWDSIKDTPEEAAAMKMRSALMTAVREFVQAQDWTQAHAAEFFGVGQPRISDLMRGKISVFGVEILLAMAQKAGLTVDYVVRPINQPAPARKLRTTKKEAAAAA